MDPIIPIDPPLAPRSPLLLARGTRADQLASYLAFASALLALALCTYFWMRFLENDENGWGMASAFLLCFGGGAFAYGPAVLTGLMARKSYKQGPSKRRYTLVLILLGPWLALSLALMFFSPLALVYSVALFIIVALLSLWAGYSLYKI